MTDTTQTGDFDDVDALGAFTTDTRAFDTRVVSDISDAVAVIDEFRNSSDTTPWVGLDRADIADRLEELVNDSRLIQQGGLNLCGPAALICMWAGRDPLAFAEFATALFNTGTSSIGTLTIEPNSDLLSTDYTSVAAQANTRGADWMVLGAIRNTTNVFWQGTWRGDPDQELAALTRPEELADWLTATGIYGTVRNEANWATSAGIPHATDLVLSEGRDVALLIHTNLFNAARHTDLDHTFIMDQFPNHYVVALNSPTVAIADDDNGRFSSGDVLLSVWSWGRDTNNLDLAVPPDAFADNYFGAIIADLA